MEWPCGGSYIWLVSSILSPLLSYYKTISTINDGYKMNGQMNGFTTIMLGQPKGEPINRISNPKNQIIFKSINWIREQSQVSDAFLVNLHVESSPFLRCTQFKSQIFISKKNFEVTSYQFQMIIDFLGQTWVLSKTVVIIMIYQ